MRDGRTQVNVELLCRRLYFEQRRPSSAEQPPTSPRRKQATVTSLQQRAIEADLLLHRRGQKAG